MRFTFSRTNTLIGAAVLLVIIIGVMVARSGNGDYEVLTVERRDLVEEVVLSGTVEARIVADLGFEVSGTVSTVSVDENDRVFPRARLASLSLGTLVAELASAKADAAIKRAEAANTAIDIDNILSELLSDDLIARAHSSTYTQTPPIITGRYAGSEGTYKIIIRAQSPSTDYDLAVYNLERVEPVEIDKTGATALGTRGLYITFPDTLATYRDTIWYVTIPNIEGSSYAANYTAYKQAEADLRAQQSGSSVIEAELQKAEAEVARIEAQIAQRVLVAPFGGIVTTVHVDPGEAVSANSPVVSLISEDGFGVEVDLPEIDSVKVRVGDLVSIVLDAFGESEAFSGTVVSVNRAETLVDNVSVYEARIAFNHDDERIASGMTAEVAITTEEKEGVPAIPVRAVKYREDGTQYVLTQNSATEETIEAEITTGLRSSDGYVEVRSGLSEGDTVLIAL